MYYTIWILQFYYGYVKIMLNRGGRCDLQRSWADKPLRLEELFSTRTQLFLLILGCYSEIKKRRYEQDKAREHFRKGVYK